MVDSYGLVAVVLDRRSAAEELGLSTGSAVTIEALDEDRPPGHRHARQPRPPPLNLGAHVRPGTVIALGLLLLIILGAAVLQLFILAN